MTLDSPVRPSPTDHEPTWSKWLAARGMPTLQGEAEVRLADGSRVDILTERHAVEVEWCKKWKESIGQALLYALLTGKRPAVALLLRNKPTEPLYVVRCAAVCERAGVDLFFVRTR